MNLLIIGVIILILFIVTKFIHFKHFKHKVVAIVLVLFLVFTYFTFIGVVKNNSLDIKTAKGIYSAVKIYASWLVHAFGNVKTLTGNAMKMDWFPTNGTFHP